ISAVEQTNITIRGGGTIDGNSHHFLTTPETGDAFLPKQKLTWRPGQMVFLCECTDVHIEQVHLNHAPYWTVLLHGCEQVTIRDVRIQNRYDTPNGDGIDIDCCRNVAISGCLIESGDDCITLRANTEPLKNPRPCEHITVTGCVLKTPRCQAIRVGVGDGVIRHAVFSGLTISDTFCGLNIHSSYTPSSHGATIENIRFENIAFQNVRQPIRITPGYASEETGIRDICYRGLSGLVTGTSLLSGSESVRPENISIGDVDFRYPEEMAGQVALKAERVDGLRIENFRTTPPLEIHGNESTP
ncbi:MAG: glycosyl hydrolase family 28 protein, partial [Planctomycetia bacterium]|nr:glycosyl hydrolase family 28 protein [Planctomycetia bacterium]